MIRQFGIFSADAASRHHRHVRLAQLVGRQQATGAGLLLVLVLVAGCVSLAPDIEQTPTAEANAQSSIKTALVEAIGADAAAVSIEANESSVTLGGFVSSESQREQVLSAAREVSGGLEIVDALQVRQ